LKIAAVLNVSGVPETPPLYIVAEKIVANYEYLSSDWPIHGTTGYEFANIIFRFIAPISIIKP
jgi:(1->4)-alpha-D-glucan 1-alpha-D-glucosylmutase